VYIRGELLYERVRACVMRARHHQFYVERAEGELRIWLGGWRGRRGLPERVRLAISCWVRDIHRAEGGTVSETALVGTTRSNARTANRKGTENQAPRADLKGLRPIYLSWIKI
jgi:hypothetical protein